MVLVQVFLICHVNMLDVSRRNKSDHVEAVSFKRKLKLVNRKQYHTATAFIWHNILFIVFFVGML